MYSNCDICLRRYDPRTPGVCYDCDVNRAYTITRIFWDSPEHNIVVKRNLTLREAQAHCKDPETSSSTATAPGAILLKVKYGPWFDGYNNVPTHKN